MSLIPSESYSFPDHFTRTIASSRHPKEEEQKPIQPVILEPPPRKKNPIVPMLRPELQRQRNPVPATENGQVARKQPVPPMPVRPAPRREVAPTLEAPPRGGSGFVPLIPSPAAPQAENVVPIKPIKPPRRSAAAMPGPAFSVMPKAPQVPLSRPAPVPKAPRPIQVQAALAKPRMAVPSDEQSDFFEAFALNGDAAAPERRRCSRTKFRRFVMCETIAVGILIPLAILGLSRVVTSPVLVWVMNILTIAAVVSAAVIPIIFYAATPTLPQIER